MIYPVPTGFKCLRCGNCCSIEGAVSISNEDIERMAEYLGLSEPEFTELFTELKQNRTGLRLKDHPDGSCIFLQHDRTCRVNPAKPSQCTTFPHKWNYSEWTRVCSFNYPTQNIKEPNET